jgi:hypothetical protein
VRCEHVQSQKQANLPQATGNVAWLGPLPLLPGESAQDYQNLTDHLSADVRPKDTIEEIFLRDVIDLTWEVMRLRRLRDAFLAANVSEGLRSVLPTITDIAIAEDLVEGWKLRKPKAMKSIDDYLASHGLTMDAAHAETFARFSQEMETINRLLTGAEARRNQTLREIERHRAALASATARALQDIEEAEYRSIDEPLTALEQSSRDEAA